MKLLSECNIFGTRNAYYPTIRYFLNRAPVLLWLAINWLSILLGKRRRRALPKAQGFAATRPRSLFDAAFTARILPSL